ncbi:unnamed protein product [Moneuplotes crassus]|uniref:Uncharacterized protein n=1 Tax=Euplotes crassus TaxID=5936 RepID=A0AAD1XQD6_EUPCR|nr:unnamed protein product [Moneuplotes crassus]
MKLSAKPKSSLYHQQNPPQNYGKLITSSVFSKKDTPGSCQMQTFSSSFMLNQIMPLQSGET